MPVLNPRILEWARTTAGLSLEEAADSLHLNEAHGVVGADRLAALESGASEPSRPLLLRIAKLYRRPLLVFYLDAPPRQGDRGRDFRILPGGEPPLYNPTLDALIRDIKSRQNMIRALLEDSETERLDFIGSASLDIPATSLSRRIARRLNFDVARFRRETSIERAFDYLRSTIESVGIFVLLSGNLGSHHTNISTDTFRGYALSDSLAPLILINDQDARSAWSFTALHEVTHLWLGDTGVSGWPQDMTVERYCNDVASEILLPSGEQAELNRFQGQTEDQLVAEISDFADQRNVSRAMIAYRLFRAGVIDQTKYRNLTNRFRIEWLRRREQEGLTQDRREGGPSYYVVRRHRIGKPLLDLVTRSLGEGLITHTKAGQLLGVKPRNVDPLLFAGESQRSR